MISNNTRNSKQREQKNDENHSKNKESIVRKLFERSTVVTLSFSHIPLYFMYC